MKGSKYNTITTHEELYKIFEENNIDIMHYCSTVDIEPHAIMIDCESGLVVHGVKGGTHWTSKVLIQRTDFYETISPMRFEWDQANYDAWKDNNTIVPMRKEELVRIRDHISDAIQQEVTTAHSGDSGNYDPYDQEWVQHLTHSHNYLDQLLCGK